VSKVLVFESERQWDKYCYLNEYSSYNDIRRKERIKIV